MADIDLTASAIRPLIGSASIVPKTAGVDMTVGAIVYFSDDDTVLLADADLLATVRGRIGMVVSGGRAEPTGNIYAKDRVSVLTFGRVFVGENKLDLTKSYFVSNVAGKFGDAAGTISRRIGSPESTEILFFNPDIAPAYS